MLYVIATPIGNLSNISTYALGILKSVSLIACEDTRQTRKLLVHYEIDTPCISCHSYNEHRVTTRVLLPKLLQGIDIAFVSDAGTPGISDPGAILVESAWKNNTEIRVVPGPSALSAVLSIAGTLGQTSRNHGYWFEGFLPHKKGRSSRLKTLMTWNVNIVLFESPYRIERLLREIADIDKERIILLSSEITKLYERSVRMRVGEMQEWWSTHLENREKRGEYSLLVYYHDYDKI